MMIGPRYPSQTHIDRLEGVLAHVAGKQRQHIRKIRNKNNRSDRINTAFSRKKCEKLTFISARCYVFFYIKVLKQQYNA